MTFRAGFIRCRLGLHSGNPQPKPELFYDPKRDCSVVVTPLLIEKMRRPTAVGLSRARLEQSLLTRNDPRLTLVAAPAGSGKSTLMAQVAEKAGIPVAWYRITPEDGDAETFLSNLSTAVTGQPLTMRGDATDEWMTSFYGLRTPTILFLDDLHEIAGTPAERAFGKLVSVQPPMLRVVLASRRMPEFNLASLRARNAINEINSDDLRFRVWEVEELFTVVYGEPLYPETAAALTRRTGGWAAGLQLFHLANARKTSSARQQAVNALGPRARLIRTYLTRNVLDCLPDDRKRFLVRTSALGLLTGPLCDTLLEITGSATVLDELERDQLFTTSVDDGLSYRYHEVLQRHLQMMLMQELGAEETRAWFARCAKLLDASGASADALRAYAMAEDWSSLLRLVHRSSAESTTVIAVEPEWLPSSLIKHDPWLALADARRRLRHGAVEDAIAGFAHARTLLDEPEFQRTCEIESAAIRVWSSGIVELPHPLDTTPGWSAQLRAVTRSGPTAHRRRMHRPEAPRHSHSHEALLHGVEALISGEFASASAYFAHAAASTREVTLPRLAAQLGEVVTDAADGRASDYAARLEEITLDAEAHGYVWISRLARGFLTAILAVSDGAPWRLDAFSELLLECDRDGDPWGAALLQLACAIAGGVVGHAGAPAHFADAERRLVELEAGALASCARTLAVQYAADAEGIQRPGLSLRRRVRVFCFGGFRLTVDDQPADLQDLRPRALSLLRMLAYAYETNVHRERLIDTLWPGATLDVGTRRLQVAVSSVRRALQECGLTEIDGVRRSADSYQLSLGDAIVDVVEFERLVATARHEQYAERRIELRTQALDLYTGDLFPEEGSAEHIVHERDRLRFVAAETACHLARDHQSAGNLAGAVAAARRSLELDPYQDAAWQLLADCLAALGDETAAARTRIDHSRVRASLEDISDNADGLSATARQSSRSLSER